MRLAFHLGRNNSLAQQEVLAVAQNLPFPWTQFSLPSEWVGLNPTGDEVAWTPGEAQGQLLQLQARLGGTQRIVWLEWCVDRQELVPALAQMAVNARRELTERGREVGVSIWGKADTKKLSIAIKRAIFDRYDWKPRIVMSQEDNVLQAAQLTGEKLAGVPFGKKQAGVEIVAIETDEGWWVGYTLTAANIDFYSKRDFGIPKPDALSGMLPPKLAQTMINLGVGAEKVHLHDPFCGNGRVVLEAALMGVPCSGSDVVESKVSAAEANLAWLGGLDGVSIEPAKLWVGDATSEENAAAISTAAGGSFVIVGEPYLGKPLKALLKEEEIADWQTDVLPLYEKYLECWAHPAKKPLRHVLVFPRAKTADGQEIVIFDSLVDRFAEFGYSAEVLSTYDRPNSLVRRDIVKLSYK